MSQLCAGIQADQSGSRWLSLNPPTAAHWTRKNQNVAVSLRSRRASQNLRPFLPPASPSGLMGFPRDAGLRNKVPCEVFFPYIFWQNNRFSSASQTWALENEQLLAEEQLKGSQATLPPASLMAGKLAVWRQHSHSALIQCVRVFTDGLELKHSDNTMQSSGQSPHP